MSVAENDQNTAFDVDTFQDFVCSHGYGDATDDGIALGKELMASGDDIATAAAEVSARGLTIGADDEDEDE
jgi:hypothetical protein